MKDKSENVTCNKDYLVKNSTLNDFCALHTLTSVCDDKHVVKHNSVEKQNVIKEDLVT